MKCRHCEHENPDNAKFCMGCGESTTQACSKCEEPLGVGAKFCMNCGTKVTAGPVDTPPPARERLEQYIPPQLLKKLQAARSGASMQGERRVVTMLFCDVQGSTAAAEQLDPEEWADIMNGAFEHLIAPVYRYEGTLARLMGDAILAFFGAPIAHEDDPERAIMAGLAIVQEIEPYARDVRRKFGINFDVRVGINTGLVVVGEVGTDMRLEYTAMGDAVNLAARMESTAEAGTVQISADTHKSVAPLFDLDKLDPIEVKGKAERVQTYKVIRPKEKPGRLRGIEGLDSPMVGREREAAALRGKVDAVRRGSGQVVSIMGEAGLGKSRLAVELKKTLEAEGTLEELRWLEGRSLSYQTATPYAPVTDLLRRMIEVPATGTDAERFGALREQLTALAGDDAPKLLPFLATRLGVPIEGEAAERVKYLDPPDLRRQTDAAVVEFLEILSEAKPLVVVFEDLHWADPSTLDLLPDLMKLTERAPVLLMGILRPRTQDASWKFHEEGARDFAHRYLNIALEPLQPDDARRLVANLLLIDGLPDSLRVLILEKAEGNPFYVEEVVRSLIDSGAVEPDGDHWRATRDVTAIEVPNTLSAVLNTRLDKLEDRAKAVAQTASVVGRQFEFDIVASAYEPLQAVEDALMELQRRGIVRETARRPERIYSFKHVLTQEAAYDSLLLKTRRQLHATIADVLARTKPERSPDIARHFLAAREPDKALPHLVDAAEAAAKAYATPEALTQFGRALEIIKEAENPDLGLARRIFEGRGAAQQLVMDISGALDTYAEMKTFFEQHRDLSAQASALNKTGMVTGLFMADVKEGERILDEANAIAEEAGCKQGQAEGAMIRCGIYTSQAEFDNAYRFLDRAATIGEEIESEEPQLYGRTHIANTMILMTEFEKAGPKIQEAIEAAEGFGNRKYLAELKTFALPVHQMNSGDGAAAAASLQEGLAIAEEIGAMGAVAIGAGMLGRMLAYAGRFDDALTLGRRAVEAGNATGMPYVMAMPYCNLGSSYLEISEQLHASALEAHGAAMKLLETPFGNVYGALAYCELGHCALEVGKTDAAKVMFDKGLTERTAPVLLAKPRLHAGMALACLKLGEVDEAAAHAQEGRAFAEERGIFMHHPFLIHAQAEVARAQGRTDDAIGLYTELLGMAEGGGMLPLAWHAAHELAKLHRAAGDSASAEVKDGEASAHIATILENIEDPSVRKLYADHARARMAN